MTAGWRDAPLALRDLAEPTSITTFKVWRNNIGKEEIKDFFKGRNQRRGDYLKRGGDKYALGTINNIHSYSLGRPSNRKKQHT